MKVEIIDNDLLELITTGANRKYIKYSRNKDFMKHLVDDYNIMCSVTKASDLKQFSFLHYEQLKGIGKSSIRVKNGSVERIIFTEYEDGIRIEIIELNNTHYGTKK